MDGFLGFGLGLRPVHYPEILEGDPRVDWFEAISENYMVPGGRPLHMLMRVRERWPVALHGVSLSIGSTDPLDEDYLRRLKALADRVEPAWISDHLCWTGVGGVNLHDLLPLPYTEEALAVVAAHVRQVQDRLGRQILVENISSYLRFRHSSLGEAQFLAALASETGCGVLLDVNNLYVSAMNHGFDPAGFLADIPPAAVGEIHLAGFDRAGELLVDTHGSRVAPPVWALYRLALRRFGRQPTLIEWDTDIPELAVLLAEAATAERLLEVHDALPA